MQYFYRWRFIRSCISGQGAVICWFALLRQLISPVGHRDPVIALFQVVECFPFKLQEQRAGIYFTRHTSLRRGTGTGLNTSFVTAIRKRSSQLVEIEARSSQLAMFLRAISRSVNRARIIAANRNVPAKLFNQVQDRFVPGQLFQNTCYPGQQLSKPSF